MDLFKYKQLEFKLKKGVARICALPALPKRKKKEKPVEWDTDIANQIIKRIFLKKGVLQENGVYVYTGWQGLFRGLPREWNGFISQHRKQLISYMIYDWTPVGMTKTIEEDFENVFITVSPL